MNVVLSRPDPVPPRQPHPFEPIPSGDAPLPADTGRARSEVQPLLKRIGRGAIGARSLARDEAAQLFGWLLDGELHPAQAGAVMIALRMKGESVEELVGAIDAVQARLRAVPVDPTRPVVAIPSYNGARNAPNLVPLLACLLASSGAQVVVHGVRHDPGRTATAEVFAAMGLGVCTSIVDAEAALERGDPAFVPVDVLSPRLDRLLAHRALLGLRNTGHSVAKLLDPTSAAGCLRMAAFTHPEFDRLQREALALLGANALVMRATEGEVVASVRRAARIDWLHGGHTQSVVEGETVGLPGPDLPSRDASATALWIQSVLAGERPVPGAIAAQVEAVMRAAEAGRLR